MVAGRGVLRSAMMAPMFDGIVISLISPPSLMRRIAGLCALLTALTTTAVAQRPRHYQLTSPDGATALAVDVNGRVTYSVTHRGRPVLDVSPISLTLGGGRVLGATDQVRSSTTRSVHDSVRPVAPVKRAVVPDHFNELRLRFNGYDLELRAYDV